MKAQGLVRRMIFLGVMIVTLVFVMGIRLFRLQVVQAEEVGLGQQTKVIYSYPVKAARGELLDRYGRKLVSNTMSFVVRFSKMVWDTEKQNDVILGLIKLMREASIEYIDTFPVSYPPYAYDYAESDSRKTTLAEYIKSKKWDREITAPELLIKMRKLYGVNAAYSAEEARAIIGVRYEMDTRGFSKLYPFTFAEKVDMDTVIKIRENGGSFPGVEIDAEPVRQYETDFAAHILGRVGKIYKEEYAQLKEKGYKMDATVGKEGVEKTLEDYLRGTDGLRTVEMDLAGNITGVVSKQSPQPGSNCVLTVDIKLQEVAEKALASRIEEIKELSAQNPKRYPPDIGGGAAVVIDVNNGEILAMASYPTYDIKNFNKIYNQLLGDPLKPMINRAVSIAYPPGSTYKMVTAIAALEEKVITPESIVVDKGVYRFYKDYQPACWVYKDYRRTHGSENVMDAIRDSCNYFFFEVGRQLRIDRLDKYTKAFGLGEKTGVETTGEVNGMRANGENKIKATGEQWYAGDTLQASIGQSIHLFTPVQLAGYIAAVCNGGNYYSPHLLKSVRSYDFSKVVFEAPAQPSHKISMTQTTYKAIMDGMGEVAENGTASSIFKKYPIRVGGKTGSAQVQPGKAANGIFAAFAPFDKPEIAVVVIVEHSGSGSTIAPIARAIFDEYFDITESESKVKQENTLLE